MPIITAEIFGPDTPELPQQFAEIIHDNAVTHLHSNPELLTIRVSFSSVSDRWFFNLSPLDLVRTPTFYVFAPIGNGTAGNIDITRFIVETRNRLKSAMAASYPGTTYPDLPDRNKVVVVEMP